MRCSAAVITLTIDNQNVQVEPGTTILQAAARLGIDIPALCHRDGCEPSTSCMVCVVRVNGSANLVPSCATRVTEGMVVESQVPDVIEARRTALELLLSDHVGDCMGPCTLGCPAGMDIPRMIRQIMGGDLAGAIRTVKADIPLAAVLGRICPAPCEKACRRTRYDGGVAICLLKRYVADVDLASEHPFVPDCAAPNGRRVAIVGAGPAGLSAAYYLAQKGYACNVYDDRKRPGGNLQAEELRDKLADHVLHNEIHTLLRTGFVFMGRTRVGGDLSWAEVVDRHDAVFLAMGRCEPRDAAHLGLAMKDDALVVNRRTGATGVAKIFAGGNVSGPQRRLAVRAVADGQRAAESIDQFLSGRPVTGPAMPFNSRMGRLLEGEMELFLGHASGAGRVSDVNFHTGLTAEQALAEAKRCLRCDCRRADDCKLRLHAQALAADASRYPADRRSFVQIRDHPEVIYEPGKCIDCGLCIQTARQHGERLGLTFIGRGFDVRVAVPFNRSLAEGLRACARACVDACPTGALAVRDALPPGSTPP
ncbi:MAG TPA: 2Fe-2S iron-sulfur cluster binding domain-containing protein [Phycisphaerales bacterium]|nr:2Fe-2S iron-sulfur cluster binding domain-containing protein [Phycisphaerales bacterium]